MAAQDWSAWLWNRLGCPGDTAPGWVPQRYRFPMVAQDWSAWLWNRLGCPGETVPGWVPQRYRFPMAGQGQNCFEVWGFAGRSQEGWIGPQFVSVTSPLRGREERPKLKLPW